MKLHKRLLSGLLVLVVLFALTVNAFARTHSGENVIPGLSGIQPGDQLVLPRNTIWATLTASWGVHINFYDSLDFGGGQIYPTKLAKENESVGASSAPHHPGYAFTGWSRIDGNPNTAVLYGDVVNLGSGAGPVEYRANYKRVLADGQTTGTVTVINTTHGQGYAGYRILDAEINQQNVDAIIYTIREDSQWFEFVQDYFDLTKLREEPGEGEEVITVYKADPKDEDGFDPKTAFENLPTEGIDPDLETQTPGRDGVIMWDPVPFGYYAITSSLGSWVTVNTNNPDATLIDKNQGPQLDKNIVEESGKKKVNDASFGDIVNFDIEVTASNYKATELITYYHIKDTISSGFDYDFTDSSNVTVSVTGTQVPIETRQLKEVSNLEELKTAKSGYVFLYDKSNPRSFEVIVKWATVNSNGDLMPISSDEWNFIDVSYSAVVNKDAVIAGSGNPNTASFTYDRSKGFDPENPPKEEPEPNVETEDPNTPVTTTTYVYALAIEKVDKEDHEKHLAGVRFTTNDFRATDIGNGIYSVIADNDTASTAVEYFEVPEEGFILIKGLDSGAYTFREIYTLPGYNLLPEDGLKITIAPVNSEGYSSAGTVKETDCAQIATVENSAGFELPSTGGIGIEPFIFSGALLILTGTVLFIRRKKTGREF